MRYFTLIKFVKTLLHEVNETCPNNKRTVAIKMFFSSFKETVSVIREALKLLPRQDFLKYILVILLQIAMSLLDLVGVILIGLLGSLSIRGLSYQGPGDRVGSLLKLINLESANLKAQVIVIGILATTFLITKSILSLFVNKRVLYFLSIRSALLSSSLINRMFTKDLTFIQNKSIASRIYTLTEGIDSITSGILGSLSSLVSDLSLLIILSAGLFIVDPTLSILTVIYFSILGLLLYFKMHIQVRNLGTEITEKTIDGNSKISEVISSYREILIRDRRRFYAERIGRSRLEAAQSKARLVYLSNFSKYMLELFLVIGGLSIAAFEFATQDPSRAVAIISIFLATSTRIAPGILRVQQGLLSIRSSMGTATTTLELINQLNTAPEIESNIQPFSNSHEGFKGNIIFNNLNYRYPGGSKNALSDINFQIMEGESVAIVGPSGSGKSTLVDIMLGVLQPSSGKISISHNEPLYSIKHWPGALGYVPQNVVISEGTIKSNICLGFDENEIADELIWKALDTAHLNNFVKSLPKGINTVIDDRGTNISGGQRQRLGIARAVFTNPKVLVLDEATSALDADTETRITESIQSMHGKVTVVVVAHRLATVINSDKVVYLDSSRIMATGKFHEVRSQVIDFDNQAKLMGL